MDGGHQDWTPQVVRKKGGGQAAAGGPMVAVQKCESLSHEGGGFGLCNALASL